MDWPEAVNAQGSYAGVQEVIMKASSMALILFPLLAACIPPSTLGVLTDGALPADGQSRLMAHGGYLDLASAGLGYERGIGDDRSLQLGLAAFMPGEFNVLVHSELRRRLSDPDAPVQAVLVGGSGFVLWETGLYSFGFHAGGIGSVPLGDRFRLYGGLKANPTIVPGSFNRHGIICYRSVGTTDCATDLWGLFVSAPLGGTVAWDHLRLGVEAGPTFFWGADGDYGLKTEWLGGVQGYASWTL